MDSILLINHVGISKSQNHLTTLVFTVKNDYFDWRKDLEIFFLGITAGSALVWVPGNQIIFEQYSMAPAVQFSNASPV